MDQSRFDALVSHLESYARKRPRLYRARVACLAALGYAYVLFLLLAPASVLVALAAFTLSTGTVNGLHFFLGLPALAFAFLVGRALWVPLPRPEGAPLARADAPALFDAIDAIRSTLRAPRIHHVLLADDFNASLVQVPRLGVLGWQRNFLTLGLPLLLALPPDLLPAVIAHELGHLSRNHGRFGTWVYRIEKTWSQVLASFNNRKRLGAVAVRGFVRWYAPYFTAYSFVLRRANEFTADRASADATSPAVAARTLLTIEVRCRHLDAYWKSLFTTATHASPAPPDDPFADYATAAATWPDPATVEADCRKTFLRTTASTDSHPSPADRLTALGFPPPPPDSPLPPDLLPSPPQHPDPLPSGHAEPLPSRHAEPPPLRHSERSEESQPPDHQSPSPAQETEPDSASPDGLRSNPTTSPPPLPPPPPPSAATHYLGPYLPTAQSRVSRLWRDHVISGWVQRHNRVKQQLAELEKLEALAATRPLTKDESWSRTHLTRECHGHDRANPLALQHLQAHPRHAPACFTLGQSLLVDLDDPAGVDHILTAMDADSEAVLGGCQVLVSYYTRTGQPDLAATYRARHEDRVRLINLAHRERNLLFPSDRFEPHDWGLDKTQPVVDQLRQFKLVRRAYLARKRVTHIPDIPCPVLIVQPTRRGLRLNNHTPPHAKLRHRLATQLQLPENVLIYVLDPNHHLFHTLAADFPTPLYQKPPRHPTY